MSIFIKSDAGFENVAHRRFGDRCFTIGQSAKEAKICLVFAAVCLVITALIYMFPIREWMKLVGILPATLLAIAGPFGVVQLIRSRTQTHIHDLGVVQQGPRDTLEMPFDRVNEAELYLVEESGTVNMKFTLRNGLQSISFADGASVFETKSRRRIDALVEYVSSQLPPDGKLQSIYGAPQST